MTNHIYHSRYPEHNPVDFNGRVAQLDRAPDRPNAGGHGFVESSPATVNYFRD